MLEPSRWSAIGRPLDPSYPTNRLVLGLLPLTLAAVGLWSWKIEDAGVLSAFQAGASGALALFGGWALTREVDPDAEPFAFAAAGFVLGGWLVLGGALAPLFLAMVLARIVNRTTGLGAFPLDSAVVFAATLIVIWVAANPLFAVAAAFAFGADSVMEPKLKRHRYLALACVVVAAVAPLSGWVEIVAMPGSTTTGLLLLGSFAMLTLLWANRERQLTSFGDATGLPLSPGRVNAGVAVVLGTALAASMGGQGHLIWIVLAAAGSRLILVRSPGS